MLIICRFYQRCTRRQGQGDVSDDDDVNANNDDAIDNANIKECIYAPHQELGSHISNIYMHIIPVDIKLLKQ